VVGEDSQCDFTSRVKRLATTNVPVGVTLIPSRRCAVRGRCTCPSLVQGPKPSGFLRARVDRQNKAILNRTMVDGSGMLTDQSSLELNERNRVK
jgi:hypothetical protein